MAGYHVDHEDSAADGDGQTYDDGDDQPDHDTPFLTGLLVRDALRMPYGTVKVTVADRPVCCLKLTGTTVAR